MTETASDMAFARDLFSGLGAVNPRRMFGGVGLFMDGVMFGLIDEGVIFLKTDEALKADLAAEGARAWVYSHRKNPDEDWPQGSSYWSLPDAASDDPEEACAWARRALDIAVARKAAGPKKRPRKSV